MSGNEGDKCACCREFRLIVVRGAVVCPKCDCVGQWRKGIGRP